MKLTHLGSIQHSSFCNHSHMLWEAISLLPQLHAGLYNLLLIQGPGQVSQEMGHRQSTEPVPLPLARTGWLCQCKPPLSCKGRGELASCPEVELKNIYVNPVGRMQQERAITVREICFRGRKQLSFFQLLSNVFFLVMKRRLPCCVMAFWRLNYPCLSLPQHRAYTALHWQSQHW